MKILGIDYGAKRLGLAVSVQGIAFPRGVIQNDASLFPALLEMISKEHIDSIVVGDTRTFGGGENPVTKEADSFIARLKKDTGVPVTSTMEAGTSVEAARYAPGEEKHDDAAAALILQRFLDMKGEVH